MKFLQASLLLGGLIFVLVMTNLTIKEKQAVLEDGRVVLLDLRPADPRSLMQGDYMNLRYNNVIFPGIATIRSLPSRGSIILVLDENGVGYYSRRDIGAALQEEEIRLRYKKIGRPDELRYGAETFFFQEGDAELYGEAAYAVLRVDAGGRSVLAGLADRDRQLIRRPEE